MIEERQTAVITFMDKNYEANLEQDFLATLRNTVGYHGKIIVIDYGMTKEAKERIQSKYEVEVVTCSKDLMVIAIRFRDIATIIQQLPEEITNVMLIDSGDVWFQKSILPIFEQTKERLGCIEETIVFGSNDWVEKCLRNLTEEMAQEIIRRCDGKHVKNAGMICGPKAVILSIVSKIYQHILNSGIQFFGLDQLFFNYEVNQLNDTQFVVLDEEYNYVLVTNHGNYTMKEELIYNARNQLVTVVHNAGGNWRDIKRPHGGNVEDEREYYIEYVRPIHLG